MALIIFTLSLTLLLFSIPVLFSIEPLMLCSNPLLDIHKSLLTVSALCVGAVHAIQYS